MKFTILIYENADEFAARTDPARQQDYWRGVGAYVEAIRASGILVGGCGLQPPDSAATIRVKDGRTQVEDGPYAEIKDQLGGFFLIEVADLDAALEWAARFPQRPGQGVEVRPALPEPQ